MEEERRLKKEFKIAANAEESDDGFVLKKTKEESDDDVESIHEDIENLKPEKTKKEMSLKEKRKYYATKKEILKAEYTLNNSSKFVLQKKGFKELLTDELLLSLLLSIIEPPFRMLNDF